MKAASEARKETDILKKAGNTRGASKGSVMDKVEKMASDVIEKSADLTMTKEATIAKIFDRQPELYQDYLNENPGQVRAIN